MKIKVIWNDITIAESDEFKIIKDGYYFPPSSVQTQYLKKNGNQHVSRWKGIADYYDIVFKGKTAKNAAWSYSQPSEGLEEIKGYFSFQYKIEIIK